MLDEEEYVVARKLYHECMHATKEFRAKWNLPFDHLDIRQRFSPIRIWYEALTSMKESNENAIMHHQLSLYGPLCRHCGKPLRTPLARLCAACGERRDD